MEFMVGFMIEDPGDDDDMDVLNIPRIRSDP
jgi:hypothetical protein